MQVERSARQKRVECRAVKQMSRHLQKRDQKQSGYRDQEGTRMWRYFTPYLPASVVSRVNSL
jgi:hypothetical protein